MKRKLILVAVLLGIAVCSFGIYKSNTFSNKKTVEFHESNDITNSKEKKKNKEDLSKEVKEEENVSVEETKKEEVVPKQEEKQQPKQSQNNNNNTKPKQEVKTNNNSNQNNNTQNNTNTIVNHNNSESGVVDASGNSVTENNVKTVDNEPWVKAGVSKEDYYNKPVNSWMRVDYSIERGECVNASDCEAKCLADADARSFTENLSCIEVMTYSGKYLGEMLKKN